MRPPEYTGTVNGKKFAEAWRIDIKKLDERLNGAPHATLGVFLVKGPFHPFWDSWLVTMVHLRPAEGVPEAHKDSPEETHEFHISSLNPLAQNDEKIVYDPDNLPLPFPVLDPIDVAVRFTATCDSQALDYLERSIKKIMSGAISPDSDFRADWKETILNWAGQKDAATLQ